MRINVIETDEPTGEPGIYAGISNEAYHAGPGISKSALDKVAKSPLHYWDAYLNPNGGFREETPAMKFGTAVHTAVLEPGEFSKRYHIMPKVDGRTTAGKAAKAEAESIAMSTGAIIIDEQVARQVDAVANSVRSHNILKEILQNGVPELSVYWVDSDSGILCRARPDWLGAGLIMDVKTTEDASLRGFQRSAHGYRYHMQAAFYLDGLCENGVDIDQFIFAAVEKTSPYACTAFNTAKAMIDAGRAEYKRLLRIYDACLTANEWPGYEDGYAMLELPSWAQREIDMANADANVSDGEEF